MQETFDFLTLMPMYTYSSIEPCSPNPDLCFVMRRSDIVCFVETYCMLNSNIHMLIRNLLDLNQQFWLACDIVDDISLFIFRIDT
jgi:hypothetical protein